MIYIFLIVLIILSFPYIYSRYFGLETGIPGPESLLRWIQFVFIIFLLPVFFFLGKDSNLINFLVSFFIIFFGLDFFLRTIIKYLFPLIGKKIIKFKIYYQYFINFSEHRNFYSNTVAHPFLHFTGNISKIPNSADYEFGIGDIKLSDIEKPNNTIRIACLGGSTTEDGYPAVLEKILNNNKNQFRFQVLNFGKGWWTSIHSTVNFILNVLDFKPDIVVFHHNYNERYYRGYTGLRGDGAHAIIPFQIHRYHDEWLSRYSLLYRSIIIICFLKFRKTFEYFFKSKFGINQIGLKPRTNYTYNPKELYIFKRNINIIKILTKELNIKLYFVTMPYSLTKTFGGKHADPCSDNHMKEVNQLIRDFANTNNIKIVDLDATLTGSESHFSDPIHLNKEGIEIKAYQISRVILDELCNTL